VRWRICTGFLEPVSVQRLAARARVHPDHLGRSFKRYYGSSLHDFSRRLRVQWSCWAMLEDPHRRLGDIAVDAGFTDQSHFTRDFRRLRGFSPGGFRDRCEPAALGRGTCPPLRLSSSSRHPMP
jgi:AraC family transcriptional regulator